MIDFFMEQNELEDAVQREYDDDYANALLRAEKHFVRSVARAEGAMARSLRRIESHYDLSVRRSIDLSEEDVLRAKKHYIRQTAAAEELFQIAVEKAELSFEEAVIRAEEERNQKQEYFEEFGESIYPTTGYLSPIFSNMIAY
jgi:hypothetical protein